MSNHTIVARMSDGKPTFPDWTRGPLYRRE